MRLLPMYFRATNFILIQGVMGNVRRRRHHFSFSTQNLSSISTKDNASTLTLSKQARETVADKTRDDAAAMALKTTTKRKTITERKTITKHKTVTETSDTHPKMPATSKTKDATVYTKPSTTLPWALPTVHEASDTGTVHSKHETTKSDSVSLVSPAPVTTKQHTLPSTTPHQEPSAVHSKHETHKSETTSPAASHALSAKNEHTHTSLFLHSQDKTQDDDADMQRHTNSATRDAPITIPSHLTVHTSHEPAHHVKGTMRRSRGLHIHAHGKETRSTALLKDVSTPSGQSAMVSTSAPTTSISTTTSTSAYVFVNTDALVMPTPSGPLSLPIYDAGKTKQAALPQMITPTSNDGIQLSQSVRISVLFKSTIPWSWVVHQRDTAAQLFTYMPPMLAAGMQSSTAFVHTIQLRSQKMTSSDTSPRTLYMARIPPSNVDALQKAFHHASTAMLANTSSHVQRELAEQIDTSFDLLTYKDRDPNGNPPPTLSPSTIAAIAATFSTVGFLALIVLLGWFGYRCYKRRAQTAQDKRRDTIASFVGISPPNCSDEPQRLSTPSPTWTYGDGRASTMNSRGSATPYIASHPGRIQSDTPRAERSLGWSVPDTSGGTMPYLGVGMSLGTQQADISGPVKHQAPVQGEVDAPVRRYYPDVPPNIPLWLAQERMAATLAQGLPDAGSLPSPSMAQLSKSPKPKELEQATT